VAHGLGGNAIQVVGPFRWIRDVMYPLHEPLAGRAEVSLFDGSVGAYGGRASARTAVAAKNQMALRTAGDTLVEVCNDCHDVFKPGIPTKGIFLKRGHGY
jgi:hypothetical protein